MALKVTHICIVTSDILGTLRYRHKNHMALGFGMLFSPPNFWRPSPPRSLGEHAHLVNCYVIFKSWLFPSLLTN